jgi:crotonobetainyl-CoA:carnitine CoA-transferase CaiB-like acyl-CoA transferase
MALALEGIKVVDVAQVAAVPMAARHLADFGADVIHVEPPATGDSWRAFRPGATATGAAVPGSPQDNYVNYCWENYNRNKRSIAVDISRREGQEIVYRLADKADVFLTNLRLAERDRYRMGYDILHQRNPRLVYGSLTGYGKAGPDSNNPAYDSVSYWSRAGAGHLYSLADTPPFVDGGAFGDNVAGLGIAFGVMMALFARERTGRGQEMDLSLFHIGVYQLTFFFAGTFSTGQDYDEWGRRAREDVQNPLILPYQTKDDRWLLLAMPHPDRYWSRFCRAIGREELEKDPRFESFQPRIQNHAELFSILVETFKSRPLEEWKTRLVGIPFSPYQSFIEAINDPQARANEVFVAFEHPTHGRMEVITNPVRLSDTPATLRTPAPEFGQHTEEVLLEYGYSWEDIACLRDGGVVA